MRYVDEQTKSVGANLGAITVLVRRPEPPNRRAQAIIILPGTQFSPARQIPLAELHARSDRLSRDPTLTRALALEERAAGQARYERLTDFRALLESYDPRDFSEHLP